MASFSPAAAFSISEEDVAEALKALDMPHDDASAEAWWKRLDKNAIGAVACDGGEDLDSQTQAAQEAIRAQVWDLTASERLARERMEQGAEEIRPDRRRTRLRS